eukprot:403337454
MGNQCIRENPQQETDLSKKPEVGPNNVDKPVCAQKGPYPVEMKEGETYYWCSCGKSKNQPFCDGSHKGTSFEPVEYIHQAPDAVKYLCGCKNSKTKPFCDGTHNNPVDW